jgi:iron complex transport system permease protein
MAGVVTAFCGPIAFLGIAVPHMARKICPVFNHRILIPVTALCGAFLALICDALAHSAIAGIAFPLNVITSLVGAPVVIRFMFMQNAVNR